MFPKEKITQQKERPPGKNRAGSKGMILIDAGGIIC
jgi:hypothetical protein